MMISKKKLSRVKYPKEERKAMSKEEKMFQQAESASISCAHPKRSIKKLDLEFNKTNTDSSVKIVMITTSTTITVSIASKFTPQMGKMRMMTNGQAAITAQDGYPNYYPESHLM